MAKILFIFQLSVLLFVSLVVLVKRLIKIPMVQNASHVTHRLQSTHSFALDKEEILLPIVFYLLF